MKLTELLECLTIDINKNKQLLLNYDSNDWKTLVNSINKSDSNCNNYYKLLIHKNNLIDVYLIVWFDGAETPIHDHPEGGCIVKILEGCLTEEIYKNIGNQQCELLKTNILVEKDINYKSGNKILHRIKTDKYSVSLHIYFPPNYIQTIYKNKI